MTLWSCKENDLKDKVNFKIYDVITLTNTNNTHVVQYAQRIQFTLRSCSCSCIIATPQHILPCQLVWVFISSGSFMGTIKILVRILCNEAHELKEPQSFLRYFETFLMFYQISFNREWSDIRLLFINFVYTSCRTT